MSMINSSEIVEMPAISRNNQVVLFTPDFSRMPTAELELIAKATGGTIIYLKVRASYSMPEQVFCNTRGCYALVDFNSKCKAHNG